MTTAEAGHIRLALLHAGYLPLPCAGKRPVLKEWPNVRANDEMIARWSTDYATARNTGVLAATAPGIDIDILDAEVAAEVEAMIHRHINAGIALLRIGKPPKRLIPFRASAPFVKITTPVFTSPDGVAHKVEILGAGQQYIVAGTHPDTHRPYDWNGTALWDVPRTSLPELTPAMAADIIAQATAILERTGWRIKVPATKPKPKRERPNHMRTGEASHLSQQLADRIEDLCATLLPAGRRVGHEWKVGSVQGEVGKSLGVHLTGTKGGVWKDFNTGEAGDALDLVAQVKGLDTVGAMDWARDFLGQPAFQPSAPPKEAGKRADDAEPSELRPAPAPLGDRVIRLQGGKLHENASKAEAILIAAGAPFYVRDGQIVRPIIEEVPAFRGRKTKVVRLRQVTPDMLRDHLSRAAKFERYNARAQKFVEVDPPHDLADIILARDGDWKFPPLAGVITTPTMRPDGSILSEPGYDPATKLLLVDPPPMPPIPERPSREDALAALDTLRALLVEFPFVNDASRSVALSALMTPVARGAMQVVPMHAADAPEAGSGKSYLFDIASAGATGEIAPAIAAGRNEEETEKRLVAELMTGQPIISIDNLNGDLGGDLICQAIERPIIKPRILGRSETRRIENTVTMFGNGNNFRLVGDIVRRVILCSMDANLERPELRQFRADPVATVLADRGTYIAAVLTIVRAYLAAGCPDLLPPLASFRDWSRLIRSPLVWLGCADPVDTMETARADDPTRSNLRAIVSAWLSVVGTNNPMTAGDLKERACSAADKDLMLNKAVCAVATAPGRSEIDTKRLGNWLTRNRGRVVDGVKIVGEKDTHTKQTVWFLVENSPSEARSR